MMIRFFSVGVCCCAALSSCDKAKEVATKAGKVVAEQIESSTASSAGKDGSAAKGGPVDADLQALVDETPEGFRFRNDLPFPTKVNVTVTSDVKMKTRTFASTALGNEAKTFDGNVNFEMELSLDGSRATVVSKDSFVILPKAQGSDDPPKKEVARKGGTIVLQRKKDGWTPVSNGQALDFSMAAQFGGPTFEEDYLQLHGLAARPFWFGKGRLKAGDVVTLEGTHLEMLRFKKSSGTLQLKFEGTEAVHGHPCGIFSITGSAVMSESGVPGMEGKEDHTIESGKLWLSLLYPIVLREELDAVVSMRAGKAKENLQRTDGKFSCVVERKWKISPATP